MHAELLGQAYNTTRASLAKERVEGQGCATTDVFRSTVSRRRPSSCTIAPVCLPWNAATDSDSSLEQQGIIWKGWQNQHTVCRLSPCYSGSFGSAMCSEHQRPVGDVGLKGGDAQFNHTFGCLCVQCHVPPFQRSDILRKTMGRNHPLWSEETSNLCTCARSPFFSFLSFFFYKAQESVLRCIWLKCNQEHFLGALKRDKILSSIFCTVEHPWGELCCRGQEHICIF